MESSRLLYPVLGLMLALGAGAWLVWYLRTPTPVPTENAIGEPVLVNTYTYRAGNFTIEYPDEWHVGSAKLPPGFVNEKFALIKDENPCVYAYASEEASDGTRMYIQTTPGEGLPQSVGSWWEVPRSQVASDFQPQFDGRIPLPNEVRWDQATYTVPGDMDSAFVLYDSDGSSVPDRCAAEAAAMFSSINPYFEPASILSDFTGTLKVIPERLVRNGSVLAFKKDGEDEFKELTSFDAVVPQITVSGDALFYLRNGSLMTSDVRTGTERPVPGIATTTTELVTDFYVRDGRIWYLQGEEFCNDYKTVCDLEIHEIPASGGVSALLGQVRLESGSILGFSPSENTLYLLSSFGDAGEYSYTVFAYSYATGAVTKVLSDFGSGDDPPEEHAEADAEIARIRDAVGEDMYTNEVKISGGHLSAGPMVDEGQYGNFRFLGQ